VKLLLDTHALIWWLTGPERLNERARREIADLANDVYVSSATAWEMAVKTGLGRLPVPPNLQAWLPEQLSADRLMVMPVTLTHALGVKQLPLHHRDPFDRLLIAQAMTEDMLIVTRDRIFQGYPVRLLPC